MQFKISLFVQMPGPPILFDSNSRPQGTSYRQIPDSRKGLLSIARGGMLKVQIDRCIMVCTQV